MREYLVFRLYAPLASWGEIAVGESRHSATYPSRSALLGLLGAAMGVRRDDEAEQRALCATYRFGVKLHTPGHPLRDFHTVQVGPQIGKLRYRTRRQELTLPAREQLGTLLSAREYRCDSFSTVVVVADEALYASLAAKLKRPDFPLYLGRKSCPPAAPLTPKVAKFASLKTALDAFDSDPFPELVAHIRDKWKADSRERNARRLKLDKHARYYWDEAFGADGLTSTAAAAMTLVRHDEPVSRTRWQFAPRHEHVWLEPEK